MVKKLAIFASGTGSNAEKIIDYFQDRSDVEVAIVLSNKEDAKVLNMAEGNGIETMVFNRQEFLEDNTVLEKLAQFPIEMVILAGFLWKVPDNLLEAYENRVLNIHPSLLPKFGGKGMYGQHVHQAVIDAGEKESGITIHYVNEHYDEGGIVFQGKCEVLPDDTAQSLARRVLKLEHQHFPIVVDQLLKG
jgi:phosphoribosylglycinamide formyltransferase-1